MEFKSVKNNLGDSKFKIVLKVKNLRLLIK